jgi:hypothetical protein
MAKMLQERHDGSVDCFSKRRSPVLNWRRFRQTFPTANATPYRFGFYKDPLEAALRHVANTSSFEQAIAGGETWRR